MESNDDFQEHDLNRCGPAMDLYQSASSDSESKSSKLEWEDDDDGEETSSENDNGESVVRVESTEINQSKSDDDLGMGFDLESDENLHEYDINQCDTTIELCGSESSESNSQSSKLVQSDDHNDRNSFDEQSETGINDSNKNQASC